MGRKFLFFVIMAVSAAFLASGCSTVPKRMREEVSGIKSKVDTLESRVESVETKQAEAQALVSQQSQTIDELRSARESAVTTNITTRERPVKSRERTKDIQACLKNAGFYKGKIDGVKGKGTKRAIKEFQAANGLRADGVVGPKTWEILSRYASASDAGPTEEGATK